jgi:hypothetical protein
MPIYEDFESGSSGWTNGGTTAGGRNFSSFLGRFGAWQQTEKTYQVVDAAAPVSFSFDLYEIDSWDGEAFKLFVNGELIFAKSLSSGRNDGASSGSVDGISWKMTPLTKGTSDLGFASGKWSKDQKFHVEVTIADPSDKITIGFASTLDQSVSDESFGIDNVQAANLADMRVAAASIPAVIEHPSKIGMGTWDIDANGSALEDLGKIDFGWYYNWQPDPLWKASGVAGSSAEFVPMIWGRAQATSDIIARIAASSADYLLGFNEPDNGRQANMSVQEAIDLWPLLMSTGKILGSPGATTGETLGEDSWLGQFMEQASAKGYRVDFIAVHYYSDNPDVDAFESFLKAVYAEYQKPIWVTEWALVDWSDQDKFTVEQLAAFASEAIQMMDDLAFVQRHAWFGFYDGGDGWHINTQLASADGSLTALGSLFQGLAAADEVGSVDPEQSPGSGGSGQAGTSDPEPFKAADLELVAATYQFFTGAVPDVGGFQYLIDSPQNSGDLNDAYYAGFNQENRFLNFANNLASFGIGSATFEAKFGDLSFDAAVALAYDEIVGIDRAEAQGIDVDAALSFLNGAIGFYTTVALERVVSPGVDLDDAVKIVMIGSVLYEAMKADIGIYADAVDEFVAAYAQGTAVPYGQDLLPI